MSDLSDIYKQMSNLVIEQGTTMDRIDSNIFEGRYQAHQARKQLEKTLESESSPRAKGCVIGLV